jgi:CRISPR-associated protein Cas5d
MSYGFKILVTGKYACFTRPETKMERVSYEVPTPGAIEGLLKSIYWKPAIRYVVDKIVVINPIRFTNVRRNEVKEKVSFSKVKSAMNGNPVDPSLCAKEVISQRSSMVLKDVAYAVEFHFELTGLCSEREDDCEAKHYSILLRRLKGGQFYKCPCLGCREFPVKTIELLDSFDDIAACEELKGDVDLGVMLYGMKFIDGGVPVNGDWNNPVFSDKAEAEYYHPHIIDGLIDVQLYRRDASC